MAFPTVQGTTGATNESANATSHTPTLPTVSGGTLQNDILIALYGKDGAGTASWHADWTEIIDVIDDASACSLHVAYYRVPSNGTTPTVTNAITTTASERGSIRTYCLRGCHTSTAPEVASLRSSGSGLVPDPPSLTASWGAEDNLWIAVNAHDDLDTTTAYPTNFTLVQEQSVSSGTGSGGIGVAMRQLNNATQDPGTFTISASEEWIGHTIVFRPAGAAGTTGTVAVTQADDTSTASGQLGYSGTSTAVQEDQTSSASGTVVNPVTGTSTTTQEDQTSTASGTVSGPVTGTVAVTQDDQTSTASGQLGYSGTSAATQADQTSTASGQLGYSGSSATTQADQTSTAAGQLGYTGTTAATQDNQISTASGTVVGIGEISGSAAVTQDDQTSTASGQLGYTGTTAASQADQTATAAGTVINPVTGLVAATQDDQTGTAAGQLGYTGTVAIVQADQTATASGTFAIAITGLVAALQSDQVAAATGFVGEIPIPAGRPLVVPSGSHAVDAQGSVGLVAVAGHSVVATARAHTVEAQ